jgi:oxaloacetate decarboxylase (Na+ extruding) subunit alpha
VPPLSPRVAVRAAEHRLPAGLVAELDHQLRARGVADRLDDVLEELNQIRAEAGWPPLASPIGQILGSQALLHVLSAQRWQIVVDELRDLIEGRYGSPPTEIDPVVRRAIQLLGDGSPRATEPPQEIEELREEAQGIASSEEELLLLALFGEEAEPLLQSIRTRAAEPESLAGAGIERREADRIREIIRIVQETGIGEVTIEEGETRVTIRRSDEAAGGAQAPLAVPGEAAEQEPAPVLPLDDVIRVEAPMVGTFYRSPEPGAEPFVQEGDPVAPGQTLCILEAMKLMNEVKADVEAVVRRICVENAQAVQYGDLLFELDPLNGRPLDAL